MAERRIRRSREAARAELLTAAETALAESEFGGATVGEITQRAGMTRSAFYHYFPSVDALVLELLERYEDEIREAINPWIENPDGYPEYRAATVRFLSDMYRVMESHRATVRAVMRAASASRLVYDEWQTRAVEYFVGRTATFIESQIALQRSTIEDPERVARALILMNNSVWVDNVLRDAPEAPDIIGRTVGEIWNAVIYGPD